MPNHGSTARVRAADACLKKLGARQVWRVRSRCNTSSRMGRGVSLGAINVPVEMALYRNSTVNVLKQKLDSAKVEIRKHYCRLLIAVLQDLPMGACQYAHE
jgi:hypothetical protein